jgi:hypothetical protein
MGSLTLFQFGMVMSFREYMLKTYSLCSSFCVLVCWNGVSLSFCSSHLVSISVHVV